MNKVNTAFTPPCYATLKRDIGMGYKASLNLMNTLIEETCLNASITVDLWTSRAKTGYIGIICHWLTQKMKLRDVLVCVDQISYPHTGKHIFETIQQKLEVLGLQNKINVAITDNGANMIKAIEYWHGTERVGCTAHTLQLCVNKGFKIITSYIQKFTNLIHFFNSPKQNERLEDAQKEIYNRKGKQRAENNDQEIQEIQEDKKEEQSLRILRTITEVATRWGSRLASWKRLKELKEPIKRVHATLDLETDRESKKDYQKLDALMLEEIEWNFLDKLIDLFIPIEDATEFLGGQKYCTLSLIFPTIQALKFEYIPNPLISTLQQEEDYNG